MQPFQASRHPRRGGQVMILTVLTLRSTFLGATIIAGLLMLYQVRQSTDLASSAKAVFAADSGIEWALFQLICQGDPVRLASGECDLPVPGFSNSARVEVRCSDDAGMDVPTCSPETTVTVRAVGFAGDASRAFCILENC